MRVRSRSGRACGHRTPPAQTDVRRVLSRRQPPTHTHATDARRLATGTGRLLHRTRTNSPGLNPGPTPRSPRVTLPSPFFTSRSRHSHIGHGVLGVSRERQRVDSREPPPHAQLPSAAEGLSRVAVMQSRPNPRRRTLCSCPLRLPPSLHPSLHPPTTRSLPPISRLSPSLPARPSRAHTSTHTQGESRLTHASSSPTTSLSRRSSWRRRQCRERARWCGPSR